MKFMLIDKKIWFNSKSYYGFGSCWI